MLSTITIYNFVISTYSIIFAIGIIFSFLLIIYIKKFFSISILDVICCFPFWLILFFVCAKLFYVLENIEMFSNMYYSIFSGGYSFTGGILGGFLGIILYYKQYRIKCEDLSQIYTITFPLIYSFGKIGCFLADCCNSIYNFPLQLIEALISFMITIYVFFNIKDKSITYKYLMLYGISRCIFDFFREKRGIVFMEISFLQLICVLFIFFGGWNILLSKKRKD